jgi:regulator of RNase E activity RraA
MAHWNNDDELFALSRTELYTAVVGDIMDSMKLYNQFLPPQVRPLRDDMVLIGRAMPVLEADVYASEPGGGGVLSQPFGLMLTALDDLQRHEVYLCSGSSPTYALWGEIMSARAQKLGAAGAVVNGYSRDTRGILRLNFPVFSYGSYAQDQAPRGKVIDFRIPIKVDTVVVAPGDVVFGDIDGVCIVPRQAETEVFSRALEKARSEKTVLIAIENGMSAAEAFAKYGIM